MLCWASCLLLLQAAQAQNAGRGEPPLITMQPLKQVNFREGFYVSLPCNASGSPPPTYRWEFNGEELEVSSDGRISIQSDSGSLIIIKGQQRDDGRYQCYAKNIWGVAASVVSYLRMARLGDFEEKRVISVRRQSGSPVRLACSPPPNYPDYPVYWSYLLDDNTHETIQETRRITVDHDGGLNIANIQPEDIQEMPNGQRSKYVCTVYNSVNNHFAFGDPHYIIPMGDIAKNFDPVFLWKSYDTQVALRGGRLTLLCAIGGSPTPQLSWTKVIGSLPQDRVRLEKYGYQLVIDNVQESDAGRYQCRAFSGDKAITATFGVTVESSPEWIEEPENVMTSVGESAEFYCSGDGRPTPDVKWYINGKALQTSDIGVQYELTDNMLRIPSVRVDSQMVLQCNITNKHGYVYKNAYLNVQEQSPVLTETSPDRVVTAERLSVRLDCVAFGAPKPITVWRLREFELTGGRYTVMSNGSLLISRIMLPDAGIYSCQAFNKFGASEISSTYVIVRRGTEIRTRPEDVRIVAGNEGRFTCSATTDPEEVNNLKIEWLKDGQQVNYRQSQRLYKNSFDESLIVSAAIPLDTGTYTCIASNGLDSVSASAKLRVEDVPGIPYIIFVNCLPQELSADINFEPRGDRNAPIMEYLLQYKVASEPGKWNNVPNDEEDLTKIPRSVKLTPHSVYTFRVLARNRAGWSEPSNPSRQTCTTLAQVPPHNPRNVITMNRRRDAMYITWSAMSPIEHYGPGFAYELRWRPRHENNRRWRDPIVITNWQNNSYSITGLPSFKAYDVIVTASNAVGAARGDWEDVVGFSGEAEPQVMVTGLRLTPGMNSSDSNTAGDTWAHFTWDPVDIYDNGLNGFFKGYRIEVWQADDDEPNVFRKPTRRVFDILAELVPPNITTVAPTLSPTSSTTPAFTTIPSFIDELPKMTNPTSARVEGLPSDKDLVAIIRVLNTDYWGPANSQIEFRTTEGPPGPVRTLNPQVIAPNMVQVTWTPPDEPSGIIRSYHFAVQQVHGLDLGSVESYPDVVSPKASEFRVTGLLPDQVYRVYIYAATSRGFGEHNFIDIRTTPATPPSAPSFTVHNVTETSFNVTWQPSADDNQGSAFHVEYRLKGTGQWEATAPISLRHWEVLKGLSQGETYDVRVVATNGEVMLQSASSIQHVSLEGNSATAAFAPDAWFIALILLLLLLVALVVAIVFARRKTRNWAAEREKRAQAYRSQYLSQDMSASGHINPHAESLMGPTRTTTDYKPPGAGGSSSTVPAPSVRAVGSASVEADSSDAPPSYPVYPSQPSLNASSTGVPGLKPSLSSAPRYSTSSRTARGSTLQPTSRGPPSYSASPRTDLPSYTPTAHSTGPAPVYGSVGELASQPRAVRGPRYAADRPDEPTSPADTRADYPVYKPSASTAPRYATSQSNYPRYAGSPAGSQVSGLAPATPTGRPSPSPRPVNRSQASLASVDSPLARTTSQDMMRRSAERLYKPMSTSDSQHDVSNTNV